MRPPAGRFELPSGNVSASGDASVAVRGSVYAPINASYYAGGLNLYTGRRPYDIIDLAPPEAKVPPYLRRQPSRLLAAAHRIVDFYGREPEIAQLTAWRDAPGDFDVVLVHGTGGQGKSRLAMRFAELSAEAGWHSFQGRLASAELVLPTEPDQLSFGAAGRLIVVDYAERWPVDLLRGLLGDARLHDARTRVLLLARPAGKWWGQIRTHLTTKLAVGTARQGAATDYARDHGTGCLPGVPDRADAARPGQRPALRDRGQRTWRRDHGVYQR